jgi:hypothetical protein
MIWEERASDALHAQVAKKESGHNDRLKTNAKIRNIGEERNIFNYFSSNVGTTKDAEISTGIPRENITRYVSRLMERNLLGVAFIRPDKHTGRMAQYYTTHNDLWLRQPTNVNQLSFDF